MRLKASTNARPSRGSQEMARRMLASPRCQIRNADSRTCPASLRGNTRSIASASNPPAIRLSCSSSASNCLSACIPDQISRIAGVANTIW
ncbi:hypothetical protein D3C73_1567900 [compost metagenome]